MPGNTMKVKITGYYTIEMINNTESEHYKPVKLACRKVDLQIPIQGLGDCMSSRMHPNDPTTTLALMKDDNLTVLEDVLDILSCNNNDYDGDVFNVESRSDTDVTHTSKYHIKQVHGGKRFHGCERRIWRALNKQF